MTDNVTGIDNGNEKRADWIEIFNPNAQAINLDDFYLTDDPSNLTKWSFPSIEIGGNGTHARLCF